MLEQINFSQIQYLNKLKLTLSDFKYLEAFNMGQIPPRTKFVSNLEKLGMVLNNEITNYGKIIYTEFQNVDEKTKLHTKKIKKVDEDFEKWWENFPATASHGRWQSTRNLRVKKDECQVKFRKILDEHKYTLDTLIDVLKLEVSMRKSQSDVRGKNEMDFMKGTLSYLNSRQFEVWIQWKKEQDQKPKNKLNFSI